MRGRLWLGVGAAWLGALSGAHGHGMEFLLARLDIDTGEVRIELTADCEANQMLPDEDAARAAMARLFVVRMRDGTEAGWQQLAPLRFEHRNQLDPQTPLPPDPTWDGRPHQLLTAVWQWSPPDGAAFQLVLPRGEPLDALLWRAPEDSAQPVKWKMLIAGDHTEWLEAPPAGPEWRRFWPWALGLLAVGLPCVWWWSRGRRLTRSTH